MNIGHTVARIGSMAILAIFLEAGAWAEAPPNVTADDAWQAIKGGSLEAVKAFLARPGVDVNDRYVIGRGDDPGLLMDDKSLLDFAAEDNQPAIAGYLIEHGAWVNEPQQQGLNQGVTPLHRAADFNAVAAMEVLIAQGANVDAEHGLNENGLGGATPLLYAAANGSADAAQVLLRHGSRIDAATLDGDTAEAEATAHHHPELVSMIRAYREHPGPESLLDAARNGDLFGVQMALSSATDPAAVDAALRAVLIAGSDQPEDRLKIVALLISRGARLHPDPDGVSVLQWANTPETATRLIAEHAEPEQPAARAQIEQSIACNPVVKDPVGVLQVLLDHDGALTTDTGASRAMLRCAVLSHRTELASFLIQKGVNPATRDAIGRTLLFETSDGPMVDLLVKHGVPIDTPDRMNDTAVGAAIVTLHTQAAVALLNAGASLHSNSRPYLEEAARLMQTSVIAALIGRGADVNARDAAGRTALSWVAAKDYNAARTLIDLGADVNARDDNGSTPLHLAAQAGNDLVVSYLLERHANPNLRDKAGRLPFDLATSPKMRAMLAVRGENWDSPLSASDAAACAEVAQRARDGSLGHIAAFGEPTVVGHDQNDNWEFLARIPTRFEVKISGQNYELGSDVGPVYLSEIDDQGTEKVVCEFAAVSNSTPPAYRVLAPGERLPGDLGGR